MGESKARAADQPPETMEELEGLRITIIEEMSAIRNQLAQRKADLGTEAAASNSFDAYGKPMADRQRWAEYSAWRARATSALRHKEVELIDVKKSIKDMRLARGPAGVSEPAGMPGDCPIQMLAALHQVVRRLAHRIGFDKMDARDQEIADHVRTYLQHRA